jgi:hypothetical protein
MKKEITVYIASPYTHGWMPTNVRRQMDMGNKLMDLGYYPMIPLLSHFMEVFTSRTEEEWLELDFVWIKRCDALLRLKPLDENGNEITSPGGDREVQVALDNNIPVFYSIEELNDYFKSNAKQLKI